MDGRGSRNEGGVQFGRVGGSMGRGCSLMLLSLANNELTCIARACII